MQTHRFTRYSTVVNILHTELQTHKIKAGFKSFPESCYSVRFSPAFLAAVFKP